MKVAPFAGAWIEITRGLGAHLMAWSLPSRERGLKFTETLQRPSGDSSLPSRERGLKFLALAVGVGATGRSLRGSVD